MPADGTETIMVVTRQRFLETVCPDSLGSREGFLPRVRPGRGGYPDPLLASDLLAEHSFGRKRTEALEHDPSVKQLISYGVLTCGGRIFVYRRRTGDRRLLHRWSVGVGGHVRADDRGVIDPFNRAVLFGRAMRRELDEEVGPHQGMVREVGLVNDDETPVGRVHLGVVYRVHVRDPGGLTLGDEIEPVGWLTPAEVLEAASPDGANFERWSGLIVSASCDGAAPLWTGGD